MQVDRESEGCTTLLHGIQWSFFIADTTGMSEIVHCKEVTLVQRLSNTVITITVG